MADNNDKIIIGVEYDTSEASNSVQELNLQIDEIRDKKIDEPFVNLRTRIREATVYAQQMAEQFGRNSQQFADAGAALANLRDEFEDLNTHVNSFNPDNRFQSFVSIAEGSANAVQGIVGALQAVGVKSEDAEAAISRLQGIMAFTDSLGSINTIVDGFNNLRSVVTSSSIAQRAWNFIQNGSIGISFQFVRTIITQASAFAAQTVATIASTTATGLATGAMKLLRGAMLAVPIVAIVSGIIYLVQNFEKLKNSSGFLGKAIRAVGDVIGGVVDALKEFGDWLGLTSFAADEAAEKQVAAQKKISDATLDRYDMEIRYAKAAGKDTYELELKKREANYETLKQQLGNLLVLDKATGQYVAKDKEKYDEILNKIKENQVEKNELILSHNKKEADDNKAKHEKIAAQNKAAHEKQLAEQKKFQEDLKRVNKELDDFYELRNTTEYEKEVIKLQHQRDERIKAAHNDADTLIKIKEAYYTQLRDLDNKFNPVQTKTVEPTQPVVPEFKNPLAEKQMQIENDITANLKRNIEERILSGEEQMAHDQAVLDFKLEMANNIGAGIGLIGGFLKKGTAASKVAAVAEIGIGTATGFINALDIAQKSAKGTGPGAAFAMPLFYASQVVAVLGAAAKAKSALSQVKEGGSANVSTPSAPSLSAIAPVINAQAAIPQPTQNVNVTNSGFNQPVKAYIVNSELQSNEQRNKFLNEVRSFG